MKGSAVRIRASAPWKGLLSGPFTSTGRRGPPAGGRRGPAVAVAVAVEQGLRRQRRVEVGRLGTLLDPGGAVGARLPQPLERALAIPAGLLQLRRADRADEIRVLHVAPADRAVRLALREPPLERPDLDLPCPCVLEGLRRAEEQIDERPHEGHEPEEGRRGDEP